MTTPTLTYFKGWGLAEQSRWLLAYGAEVSVGVTHTGPTFRNVALSSFSEFDKLRNDGSLPFGQLPLLEMDGFKISQSQAMIRYIAKRSGLAGGTLAEQVRCDMIAEAVKDARLGVVKWPFSPDKDAHLNDFVAPLIAKWYPKFDAMIADDKELTYAHILIAEMVSSYDLMFESKGVPPPSADYENLKDLTAKVVGLPQMKEYLESDKRFPFPAEGEICNSYVENVEVVLGRR